MEHFGESAELLRLATGVLRGERPRAVLPTAPLEEEEEAPPPA